MQSGTVVLGVPQGNSTDFQSVRANAPPGRPLAPVQVALSRFQNFTTSLACGTVLGVLIAWFWNVYILILEALVCLGYAIFACLLAQHEVREGNRLYFLAFLAVVQGTLGVVSLVVYDGGDITT